MTEPERIARQQQIDAAKSADDRNREGQFATPYPLAVEIAGLVKRYWTAGAPAEFLEPSVGTGAFYSAVKTVFPALDRAVGVEKDPAFAGAAAELWSWSGLEVIRGDFTRQKPPAQKFTLLVTNPPYVRHHHLDADEKARLRDLVLRRTGLRLSGLAGLYCYFVLLADAWVAEGGISAWLIPGEFLDVNYGVSVKEYLTRQVRLLHVHRFSPADVQFADALVSSTVVVFKKAAPDGRPVVFSQGGKPTDPETSKVVPADDLRPSRKWSKFFNGSSHHEDVGTRFGDLFTIKRGLATGSNDFFIMTAARARQLRLPAKFLRPILPSPRAMAETVVTQTDLVVLDCPLEPEDVRQQHPKLWTYLETGIAAKVHEGYLASRRTPWYSQEDRPAAPFLCTYMGRHGKGGGPFRFIWNRSKATAHNVYLMLYPRGRLKAALAAEPTLEAKVFEALRTLDVTAVSNGGRVYGGGLHKVEPKELANLPADFLLRALGGAVSAERTHRMVGL